MPLDRSDGGIWTGTVTPSEDQGVYPPALVEALPRYATAIDRLFAQAQGRNELEFLWSLFRVQGVEDPGWDAYRTTTDLTTTVARAHAKLSSGDAGDQRASRYLALWLYGHIVEASAPYEVIANLLEVACGSHYAWGTNFPPKKSGAPQSPGEKLAKIRRLADVAGLPDVTLPLQEVWNRHLRNAVFHSDYTIYDDELRLRNPTERIAWADVLSRVNRALAYHGALEAVFQWYIGEYKEPKRIPTSEHFDGHPELEWVVVVREGYGAAGVKDAWDVHDEETGRIPLRVGQFYPDEVALLNADPALAVLPARS